MSIPATLRQLRPAARAYLYGSAFMGAAQAVTWTFLTRWLNVQGHTKTEIGTFQSLDSWGKVAIALPAAFLLARRPARGVFVLSALVAGCVYLVLPFLPSLRWMYAANFVAGLAMTVHYVAIAPFLFRHTGKEERAAVFSLAEAARTFAAVAGAGIGGFVVARLAVPLGGEVEATSAVISGAGLCSIVAAYFYSRIHDPEPSMAGGHRILPVVRDNAALLARFAAPQFLISCGSGFCIPFLPTYFQERFDVSPDGWGYLFASGQVLMTLGFLMTPFLLSRFGFVKSMVAIEVSSLPFFLMLAFTTSLPVAMFAFLMRGALMNATHPILKNLMMQATPAGVREVQTGVNATLWGVGWVVGPLAAGRVLDATSDDYAVLMCTTVGLYVVAAILTWTLLRDVERRVLRAAARGETELPQAGEGARVSDPAATDAIAPLTELKGVGHAKAARLARLGLRSVRDLLLTQPVRLVVWPEPCAVSEARSRKGERVTIEGRVTRSVLQRIGGKRSLVRATLGDGTGEIDLVFFNQPWMKEQLATGTQAVAHGQVVDVRGPAIGGPRLGTEERPLPPPGTLAPEYAGGEGVSGEVISAWIQDALDRYGEQLTEPLPDVFLERAGAPTAREAAFALHRPESIAAFEHARKRFALQPILVLQARVHARRRKTRGKARATRVSSALHTELTGRFPYTLTGAQTKVVGELRADLAKTRPMRRLLQGDVGSGKTAVAAYAAMAVAENGGQVAVMAPTEVLASQHAYGLAPILESYGLRTALLTGALRAPDRRDVVERLGAGEIDVVFGTHALFSDDVAFRRLDLAVIDEQHRFGVAQRERLAAKGQDVHVLLMTATPIPRTLALTVYGDLEVSVLDASPPGRGEVVTRWARGDDRRKMPRFLLERLDAGEQIYWVVPRIGGESAAGETKTAASAEKRHEDLIGRPRFAAAGIELVHGRLAPADRSLRLDRFRRGEIGTIVATTVVEVGVDVANATVMVIEDAHRLGLAQLHQLRGRVGRGAKPSYCFLLGDKKAEERFRLLERSRDGFELAEEDLRQRGMGDLLGLRQSGENLEGLIDPERDLHLLLAARDLFQDRPDLVDAFL